MNEKIGCTGQKITKIWALNKLFGRVKKLVRLSPLHLNSLQLGALFERTLAENIMFGETFALKFQD